MVGSLQLFIRFAGCNLSCSFCDTPYAREVPRKATISLDGRIKKIQNPLSMDSILALVRSQKIAWISITGGEPLLQVEFIEAFLDHLKGRSLLLETNATLPEALYRVANKVDLISVGLKLDVDIKIYQRSLSILGGRDFYVKVIVSSGTSAKKISKVASLVASIDPTASLILQPQTEDIPNLCTLINLYRAANTYLENVRVIPQIHRFLKIK